MSNFMKVMLVAIVCFGTSLGYPKLGGDAADYCSGDFSSPPPLLTAQDENLPAPSSIEGLFYVPAPPLSHSESEKQRPTRETHQNSNGQSQTFTVKGVSFKMVYVQGGSFNMGCTSEQGSDCGDSEKPAHRVSLSSYQIGETEVTQELYQAVMGNNPSYYSSRPQRPVEKVSWNDAQKFIYKLNSLTNQNFRLPTEAEWEYAARGGKKSRGYKYAGSNSLKDVAWFDENSYDLGKNHSNYGTNPVGQKQGNELGLYDMSGNVYEWCQDWYGDYSSSSQTNPKGPPSGSSRVRRGGSWRYFAQYCRVAGRFDKGPGYSPVALGFRLSKTVTP